MEQNEKIGYKDIFKQKEYNENDGGSLKLTGLEIQLTQSLPHGLYTN